MNETTPVGIDSVTANINDTIESTPSVEIAASIQTETPVHESVITKTIQTASLSVLLRIVITGEISSLAVSLDKTTTNILLELLNTTPSTFDTIQETIQLIVQDGKLNAADIPHLYKVVTEVYPLVKQSKLRPSSLECAKIVGTIVKVVIHVLVNEHKIQVSNPAKFLTDIDGLVDNAIELVSLAKTIKQQTPKCFRLFGRRK